MSPTRRSLVSRPLHTDVVVPSSIGSNSSSLLAQRQLAKASEVWTNSLQRLSSGQRINTASDCAAGLAIADSLAVRRRVYTQSVRNVNDGISHAAVNLASTGAASYALGDFDGNGKTDVATFHLFNRIYFQNPDRSCTPEQIFGAGSSASGSAAADVNQDGKLDLVMVSSISSGTYIGNGDGTFSLRTSEAGTGTGASNVQLRMADLNGDGILDRVANRNGSGLIVGIAPGDGSLGAVAT